MGEGDLRGDIRRVIFTKVRDNSISVMNDAKAINKNLSEFSKRYEDFDQLEKLNIELTVPIQLPPNGKIGDCKAVVLEVQKSFNELGGGSRIYHALGSWLDDANNVVADNCVVVYAAMPINKWYECIPVLQRLIRDEIQTKIFQECVFLRIDNQTFGDPLNLLGNQTKDFPSIDEFGDIDPACEMILVDYESHPVQTVMKQIIKGDKNTQIKSGQNTVVSSGEGSIAASGNITVKSGPDPEFLAKYTHDLIKQLNKENRANETRMIGQKIVVLTGAGISQESGIETFEENRGLWNGFLKRELATKTMWDSDRKLVWDFYQDRRNQLLKVEPNPAHFAIQKLAENAQDFILITQNVDDLHIRAGSKSVIQMHGNLRTLRCEITGLTEERMSSKDLSDGFVFCNCCTDPSCMRPDIVWYNEVPMFTERINAALNECDVFIVVGSSGHVWPAASYVDIARASGAKTILVNLRPPSNIESFNEIHLGKAGRLLPDLVDNWISSVR